MIPDNEMHYFGQVGLIPVQIQRIRYLMRIGLTLVGIEKYMNVPYSIVTAIRYGKFFK
jgi:hypothetical protein